MRKFHLISTFAGVALAFASSMFGPSAAVAAPSDPGISLMQEVISPVDRLAPAVIDMALPASMPSTCEAPKALNPMVFRERYVLRRVTITFAEAEVLNVAEVRRRC